MILQHRWIFIVRRRQRTSETTAWRTLGGRLRGQDRTPRWTVWPLDWTTDRHQGRGAAWAPLISLQVLLQLQEIYLLHVVTCGCKSLNLSYSCDRVLLVVVVCCCLYTAAAAGPAGGYKSPLSLHHQLTAGLRDFGSLPSTYLDVRRLPPPPAPLPSGLIAPPPWFL